MFFEVFCSGPFVFCLQAEYTFLAAEDLYISLLKKFRDFLHSFSSSRSYFHVFLATIKSPRIKLCSADKIYFKYIWIRLFNMQSFLYQKDHFTTTHLEMRSMIFFCQNIRTIFTTQSMHNHLPLEIKSITSRPVSVSQGFKINVY